MERWLGTQEADSSQMDNFLPLGAFILRGSPPSPGLCS